MVRWGQRRYTNLSGYISLVYPLLFIKILWDTMLFGKTENLRFTTPDEKFDSYQTLNEYVTHAVLDFIRFSERANREPDMWKTFNYLLMSEYGVDMNTLRTKLGIYSGAFKEILERSGVVNHSKKFIYVSDPKEIVGRGLGFVFGKGNCLCAGKKVVSLIYRDGKPRLIYQGFSLSKGEKTPFDVDLMRGFLTRRLNLEDESRLVSFVGGEIVKLKKGTIDRERLVYHGFTEYEGRRIGPGYGFLVGQESPVVIDDFLTSSINPNFDRYVQNFSRAFSDVLFADLEKQKELTDILQCE